MALIWVPAFARKAEGANAALTWSAPADHLTAKLRRGGCEIETKDFQQQQRGVTIGAGAAALTTVIALGFAAMVDRSTAPTPFIQSLQFAIQIDLFVVVWLALAIGNVARLRHSSEADINASLIEGGSAEVRVASAILQNTFEQVGLAVATHLILIATFDRAHAVLVTLAGLFAIGRARFWAGYNKGAGGRAFGFGLTFYPSVLILAVCMVATLIV